MPDLTTVLTSYTSNRWPDDFLRSVTIWEAARATSAASTFFEPISIGPDGETFVDGATGANNPVRQVCAEARDAWNLDNELADNIQCIVSLGTGVPNVDAFGTTLKEIGTTLKSMSTETEKTAEEFLREHTRLHSEKRYFRFNVLRGLETVGLEEASKRPMIVAATRRYIASEEAKKGLEDGANTLRLRLCMLEDIS
jgi:predicted acylesterase/phospholipase RssA